MGDGTPDAVRRVCRPGFAGRCQFVAWGGLVLATCQAVYAQLPTAQLTTLVPPGGRPGTTVEVRTSGADQDEAVQLFFSHPGIRAKARVVPSSEFRKERSQPGVFDVQIDKDVPLGVYEARVSGRFGISNPRAFVIGSYNEMGESSGNNQVAAATPVAINTTVNGTVDANQVDYFKVSLRKGERMLIDCLAQRIDSRLSGSLVLYDPQGKEVGRNRDSQGGDPLLDFTASADGDYRIGLHDFTYRGGGEFFYRLTVHRGPHIDWMFPPSGLPGSNDTFVVYGRNLPGGQPAAGLFVDHAPLEMLTTTIPLPADEAQRCSRQVGEFVEPSSALLDGLAYRLGGSNSVLVQYALAPVTRESEPNDAPEKSQTVVFPCEIAGQFYPARDADYYEWQARKGEVYDLEVFSHQLGLRTDPLLIVWKVQKNDKGETTLKEIAQVDDPSDRNNRINSEFDTSTDDPRYRFTADEDATYRVLVRDQFGDSRNDPRMVYRLAIHRGEPDFRLVAVPQPLLVSANNNAVALGGVSVRKGGSVAIEVRLDRRYGFAQDVKVSIEGLPPGTSCVPLVMGGNVSTGWLVVSAAEDAAGWAGAIRILGKARSGDRELVRAARGGVAVWSAGNRTQEMVSFRMTRDLAFSVIDREVLPVFVQAAEDKVFETSRGGKLDIPIRVTRRGGYKEDLTFTPVNAPNELKPPNLTVKGAEAEGKLQVAATNGNLKPGQYVFHLRADTKLSHQRNPDAVAACEQEQKELEAAIASLTEKAKQAEAAKGAAPQRVQEAMQQVKQAEQGVAAAEAVVPQKAQQIQVVVDALAAVRAAASKDAGNKPLADAVAIMERAKSDADAAKAAAEQMVTAAKEKLQHAIAAVKSAEEAVAASEKLVASTAASLKAAQEAKADVEKRLNDAKNANKAKDTQVAVVSTPIRVRIAESCLELNVASPAGPIKPGEKLELPVKVNRLFGYEDPVEVTLEVAGDAKGLAASKLTIAKGQVEGKLEITAAKDAPAAPRNATVRAKGRFNNIEVSAAQPVTLQVAAAAQP